jgi:hypothetical protein
MCVFNKKDWVIEHAKQAGHYLDENGQIRKPGGSLKYVLRPKRRNTYCNVKFYTCGKRHSINHGRMVCYLAHGKPPSARHVCDHINRNRQDDRPENLRWVKPSENMRNVSPEVRKARTQRLIELAHPARLKLGYVPRQLSFEKAEEIRRLYETDRYTLQQLGDRFKVSRYTIGKVIRNETWKRPKRKRTPVSKAA